MTKERCDELRKQVVLVLQIRRVAYRFFGHTENAKDAESEAWAKIFEASGNLIWSEYLVIATRAIRAMYMRNWRRRKHESKIDR